MSPRPVDVKPAAAVWTVAVVVLALAGVEAAPGGPGLGAAGHLHSQLLGAVQPADLRDEIRAWKAAGLPEQLQFYDDKGRTKWASIEPSAAHSAAHNAPAYGFLDDDENVKFHVFNKSHGLNDVEGTQMPLPLDKQSFLDAGWDASLPTKVIIHGFANSIASPMIQDIKNAYLETGSFNVVGVDWGELCPAPLYVNARLNVAFAGKRVGALLSVLVDGGLATASSLHVVGHSLGAHVAGLGAKALHAASGARPVRVTGLDPAWPLFMLASESSRLSNSDADTVDVIHTCAGLLGYPAAIGTSDFYPNGGRDQPDCGADVAGTCAHGRSFQYFAKSIKEGKGYQADYCENYEDARKGACTNRVEGCMGDNIRFQEAGAYYLKEPILQC